jgi:hypothetical protein
LLVPQESAARRSLVLGRAGVAGSARRAEEGVALCGALGVVSDDVARRVALAAALRWAMRDAVVRVALVAGDDEPALSALSSAAHGQ